MGREIFVSGRRGLDMKGRGVIRWGAAFAVTVALSTVSAGGASAQRGRAEVNDGNRLYEEGRFPEAHEKYLEALQDAPDSPVALFNDGNALYQSEEYVRALDAYIGAIGSGDPALAAPGWYNLGNALYRQQRFEESLDAYKEALRLDPEQLDYKHNLEAALEQLEQQEQDSESEDGDSGEENQDGQEDPENQNEGEEPQDSEQDQEERDQEQDPEEDPSQDQPPEESPEEEPSESQPEPGEMTEEEAERLLQGVQEDPGEVNRRQPPLRGRRPIKPW